MQPQNNLVTEIILGVVVGLLVIGSVLLLYAGKIDFSGALAAWGIAAGVVGVKLALKAPSPSQQVQLNAQQQNLQQLVSYALGMLPGLVQSLSQQQAPVAPPQPAQTSSCLPLCHLGLIPCQGRRQHRRNSRRSRYRMCPCLWQQWARGYRWGNRAEVRVPLPLSPDNTDRDHTRLRVSVPRAPAAQ